jgi:hypothetical protein
VGVDIIAFFRPSLRGCPSKHCQPLAQKAIPAVIMGIVGQVGSLNGQRLALPREFLRVEAQDGSEVKLQTHLIEQVVRKLNEDEAGIFNAGFRDKELQSAELKHHVIRLPKNFTARRHQVAPYKNIGRRPTYGEWVRPLSRQYNGHEIAATTADRERFPAHKFYEHVTSSIDSNGSKSSTEPVKMILPQNDWIGQLVRSSDHRYRIDFC